MARTSLSNTVKELRKEYGLTQEDLALKSGVGLCFIRNLEQGKATLRMILKRTSGNLDTTLEKTVGETVMFRKQ